MCLDPAFYMLAPSLQDADVDIICAHTEHNINCLLGMRRHSPWLSLVRINADTAYKAMYEDDGIGIGCYIPTGIAEENHRRRIIAKLKLLTLTKYARGLDVMRPVEVREPIPRVVRYEVLRLFAGGKD